MAAEKRLGRGTVSCEWEGSCSSVYSTFSKAEKPGTGYNVFEVV
jgi:hypothetical protein